MKDQINKVIEFHNTTGAPVEKSPCIPSDARADLRISLMEEELKEFSQAVWKRDIRGVLDGLMDLLYVTYGTLAEFGFQEIAEDAFNEVHESNMSKFDNNTADAKMSADAYTFHKKSPVDAFYRKVGKNFVIMRSSDDKILKGLKFRQPDLKQFITKK